MSERAESAVGHQHIAALQQGKNPAHASHVMRPQRRRENLQQQPGAGVEQRQDVGHREAAALGLVARLAEVGLQRGDIGHGERRAVDRKTRWPNQSPATSVAGTRILTTRGGRSGRRPTGAGRGPGRSAGGEGAAGQQGDVGQGRVAVENLDEEPVDNGRWGQEATVAPRVACLAAGVVNEVATELGGEVLPEGVEGGRNPSMHRGASWTMVGQKNTIVHGGPAFLKG